MLDFNAQGRDDSFPVTATAPAGLNRTDYLTDYSYESDRVRKHDEAANRTMT